METEKLERENLLLRSILIFSIIVLAAALRIAPHPWNFTPVGALALFSGAMLRDRRVAFLCAIMAMLAGDLVLGFNKLSPLVYASFAVSVLIGRWLKDKRAISSVAGATLLGAVQFFLITNFGVWAFLNSYPPGAGGLLACYIAGIPFFWNTLAGDALYATLLFGGFAVAERTVTSLRSPTLASAPLSHK
jgi:Family of unknown function (DUF6580)